MTIIITSRSIRLSIDNEIVIIMKIEIEKRVILIFRLEVEEKNFDLNIEIKIIT